MCVCVRARVCERVYVTMYVCVFMSSSCTYVLTQVIISHIVYSHLELYKFHPHNGCSCDHCLDWSEQSAPMLQFTVKQTVHKAVTVCLAEPMQRIYDVWLRASNVPFKGCPWGVIILCTVLNYSSKMRLSCSSPFT